MLAPYAQRDEDSAGRRYPEPPHPYRGPFQRDRDRIIHCSAFRRLSNKTQVFTGEMGDYHRTRLTHTLEVASVARTLGRALRLNEELIEALALAHDLGHPPFGHAGEETLDSCLESIGGFCHNRHGLRIVEVLEQRYPEFPGLNLSREVLEGQASRVKPCAVGTALEGLASGACGNPTKPAEPTVEVPLLEVQVVDAADGVAYDTHDADDALEVGLLSLDELLEIPLWQAAAGRVRRRFADLAGRELKRAVLHELINWMVGDLLDEARRRLAEQHIDSVAAVRSTGRLVGHAAELAELKAVLEAFLYERVYRHPDVLRLRRSAQANLAEMFETLAAQPQLLPAGFQSRLPSDGVLRTVGDYLAGMTDRFAQQQFARWCRSPAPRNP
jgi:dGTPase